MCVHVCVCAMEIKGERGIVCVCVCVSDNRYVCYGRENVCVCVLASKERERERKREKGRESDGTWLRMCGKTRKLKIVSFNNFLKMC